jgi:cell division protein FtsA
MFNASPIIVGLEIGTSKICVVIGEISDEGAISIIGLGQARSRGVRKGEIVDPSLASEDIRTAIVEAERMADVEVRSVYLGVTGGHVRGFNNRGVHPVVSADREITNDDIQDVIKNAKAINLPAENHVIHVVRQHFSVDGQDGILNPVGMLGARLEAEVHVVHGNYNRLQNAIRAVKGLQLDVEEIVFTGLADSLALLNSQQKELGALVINLGGGTTEFVVCLDGVVKQTGLFAVGGDHVSNDLAYGLKVPLGRAEHLKVQHASALIDPKEKGKILHIPSDVGLADRTVNLGNLRQIMFYRLQEIFMLVEQELAPGGLLDYLRAGIFLCGGGARIPNITKLAEQVFQVPAFVSKTNCISGINTAIDQPEFATAIGLVKFGSFEYMKRTEHNTFTASLKGAISQIFRSK